jgi:hypothetical protein
LPTIQPVESPPVKVERVAFEAMVRRSFRVGLRVGLLVGEFGRCELATDMGDGTWKIAVPALHADSDSFSQQGRCISPIEPFRDGHA